MPMHASVSVSEVESMWCLEVRDERSVLVLKLERESAVASDASQFENGLGSHFQR